MKYLLIILAFSLFFLLPVKCHITLFKKESDEYLRMEMNFIKVLKLFLEIPDMKFIIKNFIPVLSFEFHIDSNNSRIQKSDKIVVSPLRYKYRIVISMIKVIYQHINNLKNLVRFLTKLIKVIDFKLNIAFGCENSALTGIIAGQTWGLAYIGISIISSYLNLYNADIKVNVTPNFIKNEPLQIDINCIFQLRVGHIIIACSMIVWYWLLSKKRSCNKKLHKR